MNNNNLTFYAYVVNNRHGTDTLACGSHETAHKALVQYVKACWNYDGPGAWTDGEYEIMPEDDDKLIEAYYAHHSSSSYWYEAIDVDIPLSDIFDALVRWDVMSRPAANTYLFLARRNINTAVGATMEAEHKMLHSLSWFERICLHGFEAGCPEGCHARAK